MTTTGHQEAARFLGIGLPATQNQVKRAYQRRALDEHPDRSKHPEANERFARLTAAYELLRASAANDVIVDVGAKVCVDGTPLSDLGQGLGPTTNGKPCHMCQGAGYESRMSEQAPCPACLGFPRFPRHCAKCSGSGRYVVRGVLKGTCFQCDGRGLRYETCSRCRGTGRVGTAERLYVRCFVCKGCGEEAMFNPVLPRGLLL